MVLYACVNMGCEENICHGINLHIVLNNHFGGHGNLQTASMASEVRYHLRFEISIPNEEYSFQLFVVISITCSV